VIAPRRRPQLDRALLAVREPRHAVGGVVGRAVAFTEEGGRAHRPAAVDDGGRRVLDLFGELGLASGAIGARGVRRGQGRRGGGDEGDDEAQH